MGLELVVAIRGGPCTLHHRRPGPLYGAQAGSATGAPSGPLLASNSLHSFENEDSEPLLERGIEHGTIGDLTCVCSGVMVHGLLYLSVHV